MSSCSCGSSVASQGCKDTVHGQAGCARWVLKGDRSCGSSQLVIDAKADTSPVTEADRKAEAAMRAIIQDSVPTHGVFGEEEGLSVGRGSGHAAAAAGPSYLWVLDPIDGTKSFITGERTGYGYHSAGDARCCGLYRRHQLTLRRFILPGAQTLCCQHQYQHLNIAQRLLILVPRMPLFKTCLNLVRSGGFKPVKAHSDTVRHLLQGSHCMGRLLHCCAMGCPSWASLTSPS
jgi:hypothetical protein